MHRSEFSYSRPRIFEHGFFCAGELAVAALFFCLVPAAAWADCNDGGDCAYVPNGNSSVIIPAYGGQSYSPDCEIVTDNCGADVMVPFIGQGEWSSFVNNHESCAVLSPCNPDWVISYGSCSASCGGGWEYPTYYCQLNGTTVPDAICINAGLSVPGPVQCNTQSCDVSCTVTLPNGNDGGIVSATIPDSGMTINSFTLIGGGGGGSGVGVFIGGNDGCIPNLTCQASNSAPGGPGGNGGATAILLNGGAWEVAGGGPGGVPVLGVGSNNGTNGSVNSQGGGVGQVGCCGNTITIIVGGGGGGGGGGGEAAGGGGGADYTGIITNGAGGGDFYGQIGGTAGAGGNGTSGGWGGGFNSAVGLTGNGGGGGGYGAGGGGGESSVTSGLYYNCSVTSTDPSSGGPATEACQFAYGGNGGGGNWQDCSSTVTYTYYWGCNGSSQQNPGIINTSYGTAVCYGNGYESPSWQQNPPVVTGGCWGIGGSMNGQYAPDGVAAGGGTGNGAGGAGGGRYLNANGGYGGNGGYSGYATMNYTAATCFIQ